MSTLLDGLFCPSHAGHVTHENAFIGLRGATLSTPERWFEALNGATGGRRALLFADCPTVIQREVFERLTASTCPDNLVVAAMHRPEAEMPHVAVGPPLRNNPAGAHRA